MSSPASLTPDRASLAAMLDSRRVTTGRCFDLSSHDPHPGLPHGLDKAGAPAILEASRSRLRGLQELLYANATWAVLVVIQAMDAAGKDGTIEHVLSGVNPQGVQVTAFKPPGPEDLAHDFLWRPTRALPARGMIGIFNRSHYEDVLVPRVHPEALARQHLPPGLATISSFWEGRLEDIAAFERHLGREGTCVVKLFLDVSRDEQKKRFLARLDEPGKLWKFDPGDIGERQHWDAYRAAYQAAIAATATPDASWIIVPADRKWLMRLLVMEAIVGALESLDLQPVQPDPARMASLEDARRQLAREDG